MARNKQARDLLSGDALAASNGIGDRVHGVTVGPWDDVPNGQVRVTTDRKRDVILAADDTVEMF
jgi:hypothetical protein